MREELKLLREAQSLYVTKASRLQSMGASPSHTLPPQLTHFASKQSVSESEDIH